MSQPSFQFKQLSSRRRAWGDEEARGEATYDWKRVWIAAVRAENAPSLIFTLCLSPPAHPAPRYLATLRAQVTNLPREDGEKSSHAAAVAALRRGVPKIGGAAL